MFWHKFAQLNQVDLPPMTLLLMLVVGRCLDFLSTWYCTPDLKQEGNWLFVKLGWRWGALLNLVIVLILPFYWAGAAIGLTVLSFLASLNNFRHGQEWRYMGSMTEYNKLIDMTWRSHPIFVSLLPFLLEYLVYGLVAAGLLFFGYSNPIVRWVATGFLMYIMASVFYQLPRPVLTWMDQMVKIHEAAKKNGITL